MCLYETLGIFARKRKSMKPRTERITFGWMIASPAVVLRSYSAI